MFLILYLVMIHIEKNNVCNAHWDNLQGIYDDNNKIQRHMGEKKNQHLICIKIKYLSKDR